MPPKVKKTYQKVKVPPDRAKRGKGTVEKENNLSDSVLRTGKSPKSPNKLPLEVKKAEESIYLFSPPLTPKENLKPVGFWSKKLQDLEEHKTKNKRCALYEFSGTDESDSSFKIKKKPKSSARAKKKRQPAVPKYNKIIEKAIKGKKIKQTKKEALKKEPVTLPEERKTLLDQSEKLCEKTFTMAVQTLGITSTPAVNKGNLIGASNFLFLSPIIKEEPEYCNNVMECSPLGVKGAGQRSPLTVCADKERPRAETRLKRLSCRRVLRSGKVLDT